MIRRVALVRLNVYLLRMVLLRLTVLSKTKLCMSASPVVHAGTLDSYDAAAQGAGGLP